MEGRGGEMATRFARSSASGEMEEQVPTEEETAEKPPRISEDDFPSQQATNARSQAPIRQNPKVFFRKMFPIFCVPWQTQGGMQWLPW